jgi:hypothetical protein
MSIAPQATHKSKQMSYFIQTLRVKKTLHQQKKRPEFFVENNNEYKWESTTKKK